MFYLCFKKDTIALLNLIMFFLHHNMGATIQHNNHFLPFAVLMDAAFRGLVGRKVHVADLQIAGILRRDHPIGDIMVSIALLKQLRLAK